MTIVQKQQMEIDWIRQKTIQLEQENIMLKEKITEKHISWRIYHQWKYKQEKEVDNNKWIQCWKYVTNQKEKDYITNQLTLDNKSKTTTKHILKGIDPNKKIQDLTAQEMIRWENNKKLYGLFCQYCKNHGHTEDDCKNKKEGNLPVKINEILKLVEKYCFVDKFENINDLTKKVSILETHKKVVGHIPVQCENQQRLNFNHCNDIKHEPVNLENKYLANANNQRSEPEEKATPLNFVPNNFRAFEKTIKENIKTNELKLI